MFAPTTHILPLTTIVRQRVLPVDGKVIVKPGQKISVADIVAEGRANYKHVIIDVAEQLNTPSAKADGLIKVRRGQRITKTEIVAVSSGVFAREIRSPVEGRVMAVGGGKIVIEVGGIPVQVRAGINGTVSELVGERGAIIRGSGALIQGVWGNGKMESGVLLNLLDKPDALLEASALDVSLRGSVILGGHVMDANVLKNAAEMPARGLILSSISTGLLNTAMQAPYPIVVLEGFGRRPLNSAAYKLLTTNVKRDVAVNADMMDRMQGVRPEVFISLPISQEPAEPRDGETFAPGQVVRVCSLLQAAQIGTLTQLRPGLSTLPNGLKVPAADVRLDSGDQILAPLSNLEVVG